MNAQKPYLAVLMFAERGITTADFMPDPITTHMNCHPGQINFHKRLLVEGAITRYGG